MVYFESCAPNVYSLSAEFLWQEISGKSTLVRQHSRKNSDLWHIGVPVPFHLRLEHCDYVTPTTLVRDLGIYVDSDVSMRTQVSRAVSSCFAVLRQLRRIRRSMSQAVLLSLVVSLVLSRLDQSHRLD